jgi:hypothetical protein
MRVRCWVYTHGHHSSILELFILLVILVSYLTNGTPNLEDLSFRDNEDLMCLLDAVLFSSLPSKRCWIFVNLFA